MPTATSIKADIIEAIKFWLKQTRQFGRSDPTPQFNDYVISIIRQRVDEGVLTLEEIGTSEEELQKILEM